MITNIRWGWRVGAGLGTLVVGIGAVKIAIARPEPLAESTLVENAIIVLGTLVAVWLFFAVGVGTGVGLLRPLAARGLAGATATGVILMLAFAFGSAWALGFPVWQTDTGTFLFVLVCCALVGAVFGGVSWGLRRS